MHAPLVVDLGPEICGSLETAAEREWLVTNGLGGFASGTVAGLLTRRYHGLLVAALDSPQSRALLVSKLDEAVRYDGRCYALGTNRWTSGSTVPDGFRLIQRFRLSGATPVWTFACGDALIEKRIWMQEGANTTFVRYELLRSLAGSVELEIKALVNYRDFHGTTRGGDWRMEIAPIERGLRVTAFSGAHPFYLLSDSAEAEPRHEWYRDFHLPEERRRGLEDREDHLLAGIFRARLAPKESLTLVFSTDPAALSGSSSALAARLRLEEQLLEYWIAAQPQASLDAPQWMQQLVLGAAQFLVKRPAVQGPAAGAMIAGYPWFDDWGRDTMIALRGLALETGRPELAASILRTHAGLLDQGMLPNLYADGEQPAAYTSVDAALWYFEAVRQYYHQTSDLTLVRELFPALEKIVDWYAHGIHYSVHVDKRDGLLHAGEPGSALTWMDARVGGQAVTPRIGKPIEVNALWYNALRTLAGFAFALNKPTEDYTRLAERVQQSFARFWNREAGCCFDVLDTPEGNDAAVRPNQIFAVSLPESPLNAEQRVAVVNTCARRLVTPHGLRTLDPADPRYQSVCSGLPAVRDGAAHQGPAWAWLLGPFVLAHLRVHGDPESAVTFLEPMAHHLLAGGLGTIGELFDAEPPCTPGGAIAQAWSVAEILRAWHACHDAGLGAKRAAVEA